MNKVIEAILILAISLLVATGLTGCLSSDAGTDATPGVAPEDGTGGALPAPPSGGLLLMGARPSSLPASNDGVRYNDVIVIRSNQFGNHLSAFGQADQSPVKLMGNPDAWERWTIVNPTQANSTAVVKFNDIVWIRSTKWSNYLSANGELKESAKVMVMRNPDAWEQWKLIDPARPTSTAEIKNMDTVALQSVHWNNYLSAWGRADQSDVHMMEWAQAWEQWTIKVNEDFPFQNWMKDMAATLDDVPITKAIIPGTHDSGTYSIADDAEISPDLPIEDQVLKKLVLDNANLAPKVSYYMARFARAQANDIRHQLYSGIRYFDLRPGVMNGRNDLLVVHSLYGGSIKDMIDEVDAFLNTHEKEVVILDFSHFTGLAPAHHDDLVAYIKTKFGTKLAERPKYASAENPGADEYTFGRLWENKWQVICLYNDDRADRDTGTQSKLWRHGTPQDTKWWPNKPTTDQVKAKLDVLLQQDRPKLESGSFFVLQTILTGDTELYAKAIPKLVAMDALDAAAGILAKLQFDYDEARSNFIEIRDEIGPPESEKYHYLDWIEANKSHPWDWPGVVWREAKIAELDVKLAPLYAQKLFWEGKMNVAKLARDAYTGVKSAQDAVNAISTPTSLQEMASQGNPTMVSWLDAWKDKNLNIVIQDFPQPEFMAKIKALNSSLRK